MNKLFVCVFLGVIVVALGATPNRPAIPNQWFSEIQVSVSSSQGSGNGGGLLAVDIPKNMAKQDYRFVDEKHQIQDVHILERFDLGEVYEVFQWTKCVTVPVKGNVEDPFAWVAKAVYNGTSTYRGRSHDEWIYQTTNFEAKLFVDSDNVNAPVFWETNNKTSGVQVSFIFLFFDAREPDSWVFEVPSACNKNLTYNKHGVQEGGCGDITNFAHANWNCGDVACSYRVPDGSAQPGYACAEFTARCLAAGGAIPGLGPYDSQGAYSNVNGYNLLYVEDLHNWCSSHGYRPIYPQAGNVGASYAICGDGGGGAFSHACIGVGPAQDACHNIARDWHSSYGTFAAGIQGIWAPPGC